MSGCSWCHSFSIFSWALVYFKTNTCSGACMFVFLYYSLYNLINPKLIQASVLKPSLHSWSNSKVCGKERTGLCVHFCKGVLLPRSKTKTGSARGRMCQSTRINQQVWAVWGARGESVTAHLQVNLITCFITGLLLSLAATSVHGLPRVSEAESRFTSVAVSREASTDVLKFFNLMGPVCSGVLLVSF